MPGAHDEASARSLATKLASARIAAQAEGAGVHWRVEVNKGESRSLTIHCFWYEAAVSGLLRGVNAANSRAGTWRRSPRPYQGAEYLVILHEGGKGVADGRTRKEAEAVKCARRWVGGESLDEVSRRLTFVDEKPRALRGIAAGLDTRLRWDIGPEPSCELWVYGDGRSCAITPSAGVVSIGFHVGQARVARAENLGDLPDAVAAWLVARVAHGDLAKRTGVTLERHAEFIESMPARWHWLHVLDRITDPDDVLAPQRPLIEALAASPVVSEFYSFSSHYWLCFSASSHYPWVNDGLPTVVAAGQNEYIVDATRRDRGLRYSVAEAVERIEAALASYPVRPFFGSAPHYELPALGASLQRCGSALRPAVVQRGGWHRLEVASGTRTCEVSENHVTFAEGSAVLRTGWRSLDDAASAIVRYLERDESSQDIGATAHKRF